MEPTSKPSMSINHKHIKRRECVGACRINIYSLMNNEDICTIEGECVFINTLRWGSPPKKGLGYGP